MFCLSTVYPEGFAHGYILQVTALQVRLLRVLQERTYEPLGAVRSESTNARIIVATNMDLSDATRQGVFCEDLYYRVNMVRIELPPPPATWSIFHRGTNSSGSVTGSLEF